MLFFVEQGVEFTNTFGDINESFYSSMVRMFDQVAMECESDEGLYKEFSSRLEKVVTNTEGIGWGFHDALLDVYYSIGWVIDEEEDE